MSADPWGITDGYLDARGHWHPTSEATRRTLLDAMGVDAASAGPERLPVLVARPGQPLPGGGSGELTLEDGTALRIEGRIPPDLPHGYHQLHDLGDGRVIRMIVSPARCYLPESLRTWGWAVQLYALRSHKSWGMGDLADLRGLAAWSARALGAGVVLVNPLSAASPGLPQQASPYYPSSRRYRNPLYLRIEEVPGAAEAGVEIEALAAAGRALNVRRKIDRDAVFRLKMDALERLWARFPGDPDLDSYCLEQGKPLLQFAIFSVLAECYGQGWKRWPEDYRRPESAAVARFAVERRGRVRFHQWIQWLLDRQLARAAAELPIMHDLPIGFDPGGADAWAWQDVLANDTSVGAPPDEFNALGQDWGLPPFVPHKLRAVGYEPFIQTIRAALRHAGGLRIDHVMGLFRLFWVPCGVSPMHGAYIRYPAEDLLSILSLESHRAQALIVGEDLGTVEHGVREQMADRKLLSYRLFWFETEPPPSYPELAVASVTTHDLPTVAGFWSGADLRVLRELGLRPNESAMREILHRVRRMTGLAEQADASEVIVRLHRLLAEAPSGIVLGTLEDALAVEERPNLPGTVAERPNWSLALPLPLEDLESAPLVRQVAAALRRR